MNTLLMMACMFLAIALAQVLPMAALLCFGGVFYFGGQSGTMDESRFMGWLFVLAVIGVLVTWITGLLQ
jgi:uncharacterized membrane protein